jgi:hypothetical protein
VLVRVSFVLCVLFKEVNLSMQWCSTKRRCADNNTCVCVCVCDLAYVHSDRNKNKFVSQIKVALQMDNRVLMRIRLLDSDTEGDLLPTFQRTMIMIMSMWWDCVSELRPPTGLFFTPRWYTRAILPLVIRNLIFWNVGNKLTSTSYQHPNVRHI